MKLSSLVVAILAFSWGASGSPVGVAAGRLADFPRLNGVLLANWLAAQQYTNSALPAYGGIRVEQGIAATGANGGQYCRVTPYSADLAVIGLLQSRSPQGIPVAERWLDWYFNHLHHNDAPDGVPCDHFYFLNGEGETTCVKQGDSFLCNHNDATDSAAATFFSVLCAAHEAGVPASIFNTPKRKRQVTALAEVLMKLQQRDGLFWAKADYRVKYLEDNCEVFAGLSALASLEANVFDDVNLAGFYKMSANRVKQAVFAELYDAHTGLFRIARFENNANSAPDLKIWYPDTQAQLWPVIFGLMAPADPRAHIISAAIDNRWNGRTRPDWAMNPQGVNQGWVEAGHAYGALVVGDTNRVEAYLAAVNRYKFQTVNGKLKIAWPFGVDDAGWLLRIMGRCQ